MSEKFQNSYIENNPIKLALSQTRNELDDLKNLIERKNALSDIFKKSGRSEVLNIKWSDDLYYFLEKFPQTLRIGKEIVSLRAHPSDFHLYRWILVNLEREGDLPQNDSDWREVIKKYEHHINTFIESDSKDFDKIFVLTASKDEDIEGVFEGAKNYKNLLRWRYGVNNVLDFSSDSAGGKEVKTPADFVRRIQEYVYDNPGKKILVHLGLHGDEDGRSFFAKGDFSRVHIMALERLAKSSNVVLDVVSCYAGNKFSDMGSGWNIYLSSGTLEAADTYDTFQDAFRMEWKIATHLFESFERNNREDLELLNHTYYKGMPLFSFPSFTTPGMGARIHFQGEEINVVQSIKTTEGQPVLQRLINKNLLNELVKLSQFQFVWDFNGDGKVSYNEASLYRILHHKAGIIPTTFVHAWKTISIS